MLTSGRLPSSSRLPAPLLLATAPSAVGGRLEPLA